MGERYHDFYVKTESKAQAAVFRSAFIDSISAGTLEHEDYVALNRFAVSAGELQLNECMLRHQFGRWKIFGGWDNWAISLVYTDDNYYLLTYNAKYEATTTYRVDRMANVKCEEESVSNKSPIWNIDVAEDASQAFKMYYGEEREITLRFENGLMNSVYDRFGEDITITRVDDNTCRTTVKVQLSRIFWGWFFSMSEQMIIEEPMELQALYEEEIKSRMSTWLRIASRNNMQ